jgi:xanthine/CO dehydrogenase XdhC/CoxF family maturation factor
MNRREAERYLSVHGSAYRREGARMLVRPDGTHVCSLSGGCLEPAVAAVPPSAAACWTRRHKN